MQDPEEAKAPAGTGALRARLQPVSTSKNTTSTSPLQDPLLEAYVKLGWPLFPVKARGKTPLTEHGFKDATCDRGQIELWLQQHPGCNWAVSCGPALLAVVDIDGEEGAMEWEEMRPDDLIETPISRTGGGGRHLLFSGNGVKGGKLASHIDLKANGGYIVVPPSTHRSGRQYEWEQSPEDTGLQPLPAGLLLPRGSRVGQAVAKDGIIPEGRRNSQLTSIAGSLRARGVPPAGIEAALQVTNQSRCQPPLPEAEVTAICNSIGRYEPAVRVEVGTDADNADRFVAEHGEIVRWCVPLQSWLVWDGKRWEPDASLAVERMAEETARQLLVQASTATSKDAEHLSKVGVQLLSQLRSGSMLEATKRKVTVDHDRLNNDRGLLTCSNGVVDLSTGDLMPFDKERYSTRMTLVEYDEDAQAPKWFEFLRFVMADNVQEVNWLQRAIGYSLTGFSDAKMFAFLYGGGNNGKTTFLETLRMMFGEYAQKTSVEALLLSKTSSQKNTPYTARLEGARFVYSDEMPEGARLNSSMVKDLTGGDTLTGMAKYQNPTEFRPSHFLWVYGNVRPAIGDTSDAMWSRLKLVRFGVTIPPERRVPMQQVLEGFRDELPGILAWAILGANIAIAEGIGTTESIQADTSEYRQAEDVVGNWVEERCLMHPDHRCLKSAAYENFKEWSVGEGMHPLGKKALTARLRQNFEVVAGGEGGHHYLGIKLQGSP